MRRHSHVPGYEQLVGERGTSTTAAAANGAPAGRMAGGRDDEGDGLRHSSLIKGSNAELWDTLLEAGGSQVAAGAGARRWMHIDQAGTPTLVEVDKHKVVQELGVRYRDLLQLDPTVPIPFPAAVLIRPKALVVNLETVRMIICQNQCYVLSVPKAGDPHVATLPSLDSPFIRQLCRCLRTGKSTATMHDLSRNSAGFDFDAPYELRALEVALAACTNALDSEVYDLELRAYPAIDRLATNVSKGVLEEVRQVKQVMGRLTGRVQRVKTELEEILEDDADMADMYLARRAVLLGEAPPADHFAIHKSQSTVLTGGQDPSSHRPPSALGLGKGHASEADVQYPLRGRPPSAAGEVHYAMSESGSAVNLHNAHGGQGHGGQGRSARAAPDLPVPAHEHLGHHTRSGAELAGGNGSRHGGHGHHHRSGSSGSVGGSRHGGQGGVQQFKRAGTVVRTIRTLRRKPRAAAQPSGAGSPGAAEGAAAGAAGGASGEAAAAEGQPLLGEGGEMETVSSAPAALAAEPGDGGGPGDSDSEAEQWETVIEQPGAPAIDPHEIEDSEDMLESYFLQASAAAVQPESQFACWAAPSCAGPAIAYTCIDATHLFQIDYILRRLLTINERVDDTEDLVAIEMDHRRNELVATDLMVTTLTAGMAFVAMVAGIYGMNLHPYPQSYGYLVGAIVLMAFAGIGLVAGIVAWIRHRRLMFIPTLT
ncbi:magnesium transporter MRS2-7 [Chlorella sorokiniana]|uniref:Magnesium transporter MRS2-7 n=1 Tax=Chlorella sorokiniana TaxID=3076 RepID=A0A2P6TXW5_CHLSO|nr:magnesium transporter MRS2-7 [Chlorella sorokiniana]|eukprot:PRW58893.1 magnesium transporter MRS2-7 [Chlorella sorokiniana]